MDAVEGPMLRNAGGKGARWEDILRNLRFTGDLLARDLLTDRRVTALDARERLVERLRRVVR